MNLVSIITPTRNRHDQLLSCMHEVSKQEHQLVEHIVVDDASTDETSYLPILHLPTRVGAAKARNIGVQQSHGQYLTFIDDDDILYPNHCRVLLEAIQGHDFVHAMADKWQDGVFVGQWGPPLPITLKNTIPICTVMISRKAWDTVKGMNESLQFYQDWDLWLRLIKAGFQPKFIPIVTSKIFYYKDTITGKRTKQDTALIRNQILSNFTRGD